MCGPALITDGSRGFSIYWTGIEDGMLEVVINQTHFYIRPIGDAYWENRQKVMKALHKAIEKNG
jgi:hypothetical protein